MPLAKGRGGYSLIELIVVIVLLGIMLAMGGPKIRQSLLTNNLKGMTRRLVGLVQNTRDQAILNQKDYYLRIDFVDNRVMVDSGDPIGGTVLELPDDVRLTDLWLKSSGVTGEGEVSVRFSKQGYVEPAVIHLEARDGRQVSLELPPFLGTIRIHDYYLNPAQGF